MLGPEEFGFFALVSAAAILLLRVSEFGWAQYIMSWSGDDKIPRQVLMVAILSGMFAATLGCLSALGLRLFGASAGTALFVALFSVWVLLATTSSAQKGIMIWQDKLKSSATAETLGELVAAIVALSALYSGFGILSLVFGRLSFQSTHLAISFITTRLSPLFGLKGAGLKELFSYSSQLFLTRMIVNIRTYMATFLIAGFLGPAAVGYYRAGERLVGAVGEIVVVPTEILAWSLFRQTRDSHGGRLDGFQIRANEFFKVLFAFAIPLLIWVAVMGPELVLLLLGPEWRPVIPVVAILALSRALVLPGHATEAILSLAGKLKKLIPFSLIYLVLGLGVTLIGAQFGLVGVAWSQVLVSAIVVAITIWLQSRHGEIRWREVAKGSWSLLGPILLGTLTLILSRQVALNLALSPLAVIAAASVMTLLLYGALLALTQPEWRAALLAYFHKSEPSESVH